MKVNQINQKQSFQANLSIAKAKYITPTKMDFEILDIYTKYCSRNGSGYMPKAAFKRIKKIIEPITGKLQKYNDGAFINKLDNHITLISRNEKQSGTLALDFKNMPEKIGDSYSLPVGINTPRNLEIEKAKDISFMPGSILKGQYNVKKGSIFVNGALLKDASINCKWFRLGPDGVVTGSVNTNIANIYGRVSSKGTVNIIGKSRSNSEIAKYAKIDGTIKSTRNIEINGHIGPKGKVETNGKIIIDPKTAKIEGQIIAKKGVFHLNGMPWKQNINL